VIVGTSAVTTVPDGTVIAIVCVDSVMTPVAATGDTILNAVMAFVEDTVGVEPPPPPPPQPVITISNTAASNMYNFFIAISLKN
jgi:hypothetical protein